MERDTFRMDASQGQVGIDGKGYVQDGRLIRKNEIEGKGVIRILTG